MQIFSLYPEDLAKYSLPVPESRVKTDIPQAKSHLLAFALTVEGLAGKPLIFLEGGLPEIIRFLCHSAMVKLQDLQKGEEFVYDKLPQEWSAEAHRILTKASNGGTSRPTTYKVSAGDLKKIFEGSPSLCSVFTFLLQDPKTVGALGKSSKTVTGIEFIGEDYKCNPPVDGKTGCACYANPIQFVCLAGKCTDGAQAPSDLGKKDVCPGDDPALYTPGGDAGPLGSLPGFFQDILGGKTGGTGQTTDPTKAIEDLLGKFPGGQGGQGGPSGQGQATNPIQAIGDALAKYFPQGVPGGQGGQGGQATNPSDILAQIQAALNDALNQGKGQGASQPQLDQIVGVFTGILASFQTAQADPAKEGPPQEPGTTNAINDAFGSIFGGSGNFADSPLGKAIAQAIAQAQGPATKEENPNAWANPTEAVQAWLNTIINAPGGCNSDPNTPPTNPNGVTEQVTQVLQSWFPWLQQQHGSVKSLAGDVPNLTIPEWQQVITAAQGFCMQIGAVGQSLVPAGVLNIPWGQVDWTYWTKNWNQSLVGVSQFLSGMQQGRAGYVGLGTPNGRRGWLGSSGGSLPLLSAGEMADIGGLPGIGQIDFSNVELIEFLRSGPCRSYTVDQVLARAKQMQAECPTCQANAQAAMAAICSDKPVCEACQSALDDLQKLKDKYEPMCNQNWPNPADRIARGAHIDQACPGKYAETEAYIAATCSPTPITELCPGASGEENEKTPFWKYALIGAGVVIAGGLLIKAAKD